MNNHTAVRGKNRERVPVKLVGEWDALDAELRRLWFLIEDWRGNGPERLTRAEIGRRLGVTENAIVGRLNRTNMPRRDKPHTDTPSGRDRRGEYARRKAKRLADALLIEQEEEMARIDANPVRQPHVIARIREYIAQDWPPGKPGNKHIAALVLREFQLSVTPNQVAGALLREGIDRGGHKPERTGGALIMAQVKARTPKPTPPPLPRLPSFMPAAIARASGNVSMFDNHAYRAPRRIEAKPDPRARIIECMWVDGHSPNWIMCEAMSEPGRSFCHDHGKVAYARHERPAQIAAE
jgi:hypothetical protein